MVFVGDAAVGVGGHHEQQQAVALDVPQEAVPQPAPLVRPFDDTRNIGHDERLAGAGRHDAQLRHQRRERIGPDFGLGGGDCAQQGAFARVREPDEAHIGQHFQFEDDPPVLARLAGLREAGRLHGGRFEKVVALAAAPAGHEDFFLVLFGDFEDEFARFGIAGHRAEGHFDDDVVAIAAAFEAATAAAPVGCKDVFAVFEREQRPLVVVGFEDDMAAPAAVAAVGAALGVGCRAVKMDAARAAFATFEVDFYVINKVLHI